MTVGQRPEFPTMWASCRMINTIVAGVPQARVERKREAE